MFFGLWYLFVCALAAMFAVKRGHSWFVAALTPFFLTPAIAFIIFFVMKDKRAKENAADRQAELLKAIRESAPPLDAESRSCPYCAETIKRAASECRFCSRPVEAIA